MSAGISNIPIEILERILDFLHDDRPTLCYSSLVSCKWVLPSRYHLFNPTVINEFRVPYSGALKENANSFLSLVQAPCCTILPAIQNVVLNVTTLELMKNVVEALKHSKTLNILFVDHWQVRFSQEQSVSWIASSLPDILSFTYNSSSAFGQDACRLVTSFARLQSLAIYTETWTRISLPAHISGSHFHHLRTLRLKLVDPEQFLDWLQSLDGWHSALETLDLRMFYKFHLGWGPVNALNSFLKANSGTLKHLSIGIDYVSLLDYNFHSRQDLSNQETRIDLSSLSSLSSIFFKTHDINAVCDSLASLSPSSKLKVLMVNALCATHFNRCVPLRLLQRLASIIHGNQSFGNTTLHLSLPTMPTDPGLRFVQEQLFREEQERDALKVTCVETDDYQIGTRDSIRHLIFKN